MRSRPFGSTGRSVSVIGQGTWQLKDAGRAETALRTGLDEGLQHIDTAELYRGSEEVVGRAIAGRRDSVFLVTKVLPSNASYKGTLEACRRSLQRLGTGHVDVYLLHWWSDAHPIEDTMRAMGELADQGLTRHVGVSNLDVDELERARAALGRKHRIVCDQVYYDLGHRHVEDLLMPYCRKNKIAVVGYSPFGSGRGALPAPSTAGGAVLKRVADRHRATAHQVVLNFLSRDPDVFLIPKAEDVEHVRANAHALDFTLDESDVEKLEAAFPKPGNVVSLPMI